MSSHKTTISAAGSQLPAYFMGRPRSAYITAFAGKAAVHQFPTASNTEVEAKIAA